MALKDLIVHLDSGPRASARLDLAIALSRRYGARLTALFAEAATLGQSLVGRRAPESVAAAAAQTKALFESRVGEAGVPSRWWQIEAGEYADVVHSTVICCRYADCAVFGQASADSPAPQGIAERVLAESGRPVLVVPSVGSHPDAGRRVLVAWTGSREATRAVHDALPLLEEADEVTVLSLQLPSTPVRGGLPRLDIIAHLRAHGIAARYERTILGEVAASDAVLNRASDLGADLTVMGAHGLVGGALRHEDETTRAILATMTTPVLLAA